MQMSDCDDISLSFVVRQQVEACSVHVNTPQPCHLTMKLRIVISSIKTKVVIKFEASEMTYVETRARKLWNVYTLKFMCVKPSSSLQLYWIHFKHVAWPWTKLTIMISSINIEKKRVVVKFEASEMEYVEMKVRKLWMCTHCRTCEKLAHPHMYWTHLKHVAWPRNLDYD